MAASSRAALGAAIVVALMAQGWARVMDGGMGLDDWLGFDDHGGEVFHSDRVRRNANATTATAAPSPAEPGDDDEDVKDRVYTTEVGEDVEEFVGGVKKGIGMGHKKGGRAHTKDSKDTKGKGGPANEKAKRKSHEWKIKKIGMMTSHTPFAEMSALGVSNIKFEICSQGDCCQTKWMPKHCCGGLSWHNEQDGSELGSCNGHNVKEDVTVEVQHEGPDAWKGAWVSLVCSDNVTFKCKKGMEFEVDDNDKLKLKCNKTSKKKKKKQKKKRDF